MSACVVSLEGRFIPRDAMRKRGLCCRPVSVRPSDMLVYCIHTAEDIVKLLSRPGSPFMLVDLFDPSADTQFQEEPFHRGAQNTRDGRWENFDDFRLKSVYIGMVSLLVWYNGTRYAHGCYRTLTGSRRWWFDPCRFRWLSDLERVRFFRRISLTMLVLFDVGLRTTKCGLITRAGEIYY